MAVSGAAFVVLIERHVSDGRVFVAVLVQVERSGSHGRVSVPSMLAQSEPFPTAVFL